MMLRRSSLSILFTLALAACSKSQTDAPAPAGSGASKAAGEITLLNVSYDPTREFYAEFNKAFAAHWKGKTGQTVKINQSHGGGGKQARAIIDGLEADVATLALAYDVDQLRVKAKLIPEGWQKRLPNNSSPYTSTIVFVVRKGNPKGIKDWNDLAKDGVQVITPNPKTSGGARWNYLAAWGYALRSNAKDEGKAREFVSKILKNVPVLDSGARGSTTTFAERGIGDVLVTWENEAHLTVKEFGKDKFEIITPPVSILAEPPVTVVDKYVDKHKTREVAEAYLKYLYSPEGQALIAKHFYRPSDAEAEKKHARDFPAVERFTIDQEFGGWTAAQPKHFNDNGVFDEIYKNIER